jgi:hypothetical protein
MSVSSTGFLDTSKCLPLSITKTCAVALYYPSQNFQGYRNLAFNMEIGQFYKACKDSLLHCTTVEEYDLTLKAFNSFAKKDSILKSAMTGVCRDEETVTHKLALPCESSLKSVPLLECKHSAFKGDLSVVEQGFQSESFYVTVMVNHYHSSKKKGWKQTSISLPCTHDDGRVFPYCYVHEESLVSAVLLSEKTIQIQYFPRFLSHPKEQVIFRLDHKCENTPIVTTDGKWIALVNNDEVIVFLITDVALAFEFSIVGDIPTAFKIKDDQICIGTLNGAYYRMHIESGLVLYSQRFTQSIAILDIQYVGVRIAVQTMSDARFVEESQNRIAFIDRPLSICLSEEKLILFNKFGYTRIIRSKDEMLLKPPKTIQVNLMDVTPWYANGIYCEKGKAIHVLLPNGVVASYFPTKKEHEEFF